MLRQRTQLWRSTDVAGTLDCQIFATLPSSTYTSPTLRRSPAEVDGSVRCTSAEWALPVKWLGMYSEAKRDGISDPTANPTESVKAEFRRHEGAGWERALQRPRL